MSYITIPLPQEPYNIELVKQDNSKTWKSSNGILLEILEEEGYDFKLLTKGDKLKNIPDKDIINAIYSVKIAKDKELLGGSFDIDETETVNDKPNFDPEKIRIEPKIFSTGEIQKFIDRGDLDISPDFQRNFVWEHKRKSRLIESLMLRIPLPMFYLSQDKEGVFQVVDGLQRLTTIYSFVKNGFVLKDLEYLKECEGKTFENLEPKYQRRIEYTQFNFNVIDSSTPIAVKFELFKRVNQGGKSLNSQEIRNSMSKPAIRELLNNLVDTEIFQLATDNSIKSLRMDDQELAMRFIGFYWAKITQNVTYRGDMEVFLDEVLDKLNKKDSKVYFPLLETAFHNAMQNAYYLFGKYAFRKCKHKDLQKGEKKQLINKSLFTVWSIVLSQYDPQKIKDKNEAGCLNMPLADMLEKDETYFIEKFSLKENQFSYFDSVTTGTNQISKLDFGFAIAEYLIKTHIKT
jgi:uncharacterized protein with ParB-like and HNH nuclease domain